MKLTRCMMDDESFPRSQWEAVFQTAVYLANRLPTRAKNGESPYKLWLGKEAELSHLREIGCKAYVHKELPDKDQGG